MIKNTVLLNSQDYEKFKDTKLKNFSSGMQVATFSTAIQTDPEILLMDEVLAVGDGVPAKVYGCSESISERWSHNCFRVTRSWGSKEVM